MEKLDRDYWTNRYKNNTAQWDIGNPSTPIVEYIDQLTNKELKILIPGCGNSYEAEYLFEKGFSNVFLIDLSPEPIERFKLRNPKFPKNQLIVGDFFEHIGEYDLWVSRRYGLNRNAVVLLLIDKFNAVRHIGLRVAEVGRIIQQYRALAHEVAGRA